MKNYLLSAALLFSLNGEAQLEKVIDGLNSPIGISFYQDQLFFAEFTSNNISSTYFLDPIPSANIIVKNLNSPIDVTTSGSRLYFSEFGRKSVSMVDLSAIAPNLPAVIVAKDLDTPSGIDVYGSYLYIAEFDGNKISRTDIRSSKPNNHDYLVGLNTPNSLVVNGDYLYFSERGAGTISRVLVSGKDAGEIEIILEGLDEPVGVAVRNDVLYYTEKGNYYVSKVDIDPRLRRPQVVTEVFDKGARLEIFKDDLYISERYSGDILRYSLLELGIDEHSSLSELRVYPNPTSRFIQVDDFGMNADIEILDINGLSVYKDEIKKGEKIDIEYLNEGIYFLRLNEVETIRIQKID